MDDIAETAARLDDDRRDAAERMSFGDRLLAGPAMFDICVAMMKTGVRLQDPSADEAKVEQVVLDRLRNARRYERKA